MNVICHITLVMKKFAKAFLNNSLAFCQWLVPPEKTVCYTVFITLGWAVLQFYCPIYHTEKHHDKTIYLNACKLIVLICAF